MLPSIDARAAPRKGPPQDDQVAAKLTTSPRSRAMVALPADELAVLIGPAAAEIKLRDRIAREAYEHGRAEGRREGYAQAVADWKVVVGADLGGRTRAELEMRRWGPGGRAHFADPRPGDYIPRSRQEAAAA